MHTMNDSVCEDMLLRQYVEHHWDYVRTCHLDSVWGRITETVWEEALLRQCVGTRYWDSV